MRALRWLGSTASHTRAHVIRAIMEGVAFSLKDTFTIFDEMKIPVTSIRLGGGGARSPLWRQIQADVYGREVEIVAAEEGAAYGAAILAGAGAGAWSSVEQACDAVVRVAKRIEPNAKDFRDHAAGVYDLPEDLCGAEIRGRIGAKDVLISTRSLSGIFAYFSSLTQIFRKLIGSLGSPCACDLIGARSYFL